MATATLNKKRLVEKISQPSSLRVTKGGKSITESVLDSDEKWQDWPGPLVIEGVRVINRKSKNGVVYQDSALDNIAEIHQRHPIAVGHEDEWNNSRPLLTRVGQLRGGRRVSGGVDADWHLNERDDRSQQFVVDAIRYPENLCLSIEIDAGDWEGERVAEKEITLVTSVSRMLDTSLVARGGTTSKLNESERPRHKRKRQMATGTEKLVETLTTDKRKLQEENDDLKKRLSALETDVARLKGEKTDLEEQVADQKAAVAESEKKASIREQADELDIKLTEAKISRLSKLEADEIKEELEELSKISERKGGVSSPPSGSKKIKDEVPDDFDLSVA